MSVSLKIFSFNKNNDDIGPATTIADRLPLRGDPQERDQTCDNTRKTSRFHKSTSTHRKPKWSVLAREANYIGLNHYKHQQLWSEMWPMRHRRRPGFGVLVAALPGNCCGAPLLIRAGRLDVLTLHPQKSVALARKFLGARPHQDRPIHTHTMTTSFQGL